MYHLKYHVTKMNDTIYRMVKALIQPIYRNAIYRPTPH